MAKRSTKRGKASARAPNPELKDAKDVLSVVEAYLPKGSRQRAVAKIAAAAGGALIAAAVLGVGPVALAGAAGYLVYRESHR